MNRVEISRRLGAFCQIERIGVIQEVDRVEISRRLGAFCQGSLGSPVISATYTAGCERVIQT
jgi:hypothetical protein